ncbi:MAG TPA: outer membrane beta-barrel family protein, partial [Xylanibacter oryzae]|nr:outer membrane beta-barrel family protein [Xylanibacter oryzae]
MTQATNMRARTNIVVGTWGFNYQLDDNNSLGVTYSVNKRLPSSKGFGRQNYTVYTNGIYTGAVKYYDDESASSDGPNHELNAYYSGIIGRLHLDFNGTLYWKKNITIQDATEQSAEFDNRSINADATSHNKMAAAKIVATYPLGSKVSLNAGTEYTNTNSRSVYVNQQNFIISSDDNIKELNIAAFAGVDIQCGNYKFNGGLRYEHVKSDYYSYDVLQNDASRKYDNLFPSISLTYSDKGLNTSLNFTEKTQRPSYNQLSGFIRYDDRYTYEGGNPLLRPMKIYNIEWNLQYSWLTLSADYTYDKDQVMYTSSIYNNSDIILARYSNIDHRQNLAFSATASPVLGFWHPVFEMDFLKQFVDTKKYGIDITLQRPQYDFSVNNRFVFKHNWTVECNYEYSTS